MSASSSRDDLSGASGHFVPGSLARRGHSSALQANAIREQLGLLLARLIIIEGLITGKRLRQLEHMNRPRHVGMHQAYDFEVTGSWKIHGIRLPVHQTGGGHTGGAIKAGLIGRRPWTARSRRRAHLARFEKGHGMNLT